MTGEENLENLLANMSAELLEGLYVFAAISDGALPDGVRPKMLFEEAEGLTVILLKEEAEVNGLAHEFPCRMITLNIHSSLQPVHNDRHSKEL